MIFSVYVYFPVIGLNILEKIAYKRTKILERRTTEYITELAYDKPKACPHFFCQTARTKGMPTLTKNFFHQVNKKVETLVFNQQGHKMFLRNKFHF